MKKGLIKVLNALSDVLFPRHVACPLCNNETPNGEICDKCKDKIPFNNGKKCEACSRPTVAEERFCLNCTEYDYKFDKVVSPFCYRDGVVAMIHRFKFDNYKYLGEFFAGHMAKACKDLPPFDVIVPVPMHPKSLRKRGYNQCDILARELSEILDVPLSNALTKIVDTKEQRGQGGEERRKNLHGAFCVEDKSSVKGKAVLIVDDVFTTGSTINECAGLLKLCGAKKVYGVTAAITECKD